MRAQGGHRGRWNQRLLGLAAVLAAALSQAATLARQPYLQNVRGDRATVLWTTQEPAVGAVEFSRDGVRWQRVSARARQFAPAETGLRAPYYQHQAELSGLLESSEYSCRVLADSQVLASGAELRFRTAGRGPFQYLVVSDSGLGTPEQGQVARLMLKENPALVLHAGDVSQLGGRFEEYEDYYFGFYRDLMTRAPFYPVPGNHDYLTRNAAALVALGALPTDGVPESGQRRYYSFDWGNVHFVALDTNLPFGEAVRGAGPMLEWLEQDLAVTRQFWRVAYFHHSPYASGFHQNDAIRLDLRERLVPILERHHVQVVFHGHEHSYQRTVPLSGGQPAAGEGTVYITAGGGGAPLYPLVPHPLLAFGQSAHHYISAGVEGPRMIVRAIRADGQEMDRVALAPRPVLADTPMLNAASFSSQVAPGALVSIFGLQLAGEGEVAGSLPWPAELGETSVRLNGRRLPLLYVSADQINTQLPFDAGGLATLQVTTPNGSIEAVIWITETAPAVFSVPTLRGRQAAVVHAAGGLVTQDAPAAPGEFVTLYLTGLGRVDGAIEAGQAAPLNGALGARAAVTVALGGVRMRPSFAGLAPGFVGLYQVNFQVPVGLASGSHDLVISAGSATSEPVPLRVAGPPAEENSPL